MLKLLRAMAPSALAVFLLLLCVVRTHAGPDDKWLVQLRTFNPNGQFGNSATKFGTGTTLYSLLAAYDDRPEIYCYDHGGTDPRWCWDVRAPMSEGETQTWRLVVTAGSAYTPATIVLRGWNPSGTDYDLEGPISVKLVVIDDPSGTLPSGANLWTVDPSVNGTSSQPNFTASLNWTGQPIRLDLVASSGDPPASSIGDARLNGIGKSVCFTGTVVTSVASADANSPGLWVQSPDGASAVKIPASWSVSRGERIDCTGVMTWLDGVPNLSSPVLKQNTAGSSATAKLMRGADIACDRSGTLVYQGLNPVGLLVATCGLVTTVDSVARTFYVDDGSGMRDGTDSSGTPNLGIRVACTQDVALPTHGTRCRVTGIRTVAKLILTADTTVNGTLRRAGEALYVPVLATRDAGDVLAME